MQNDFEQHISQQLQDFSLAPQPDVWQRVEAALPPQKKRRRIVFWWWLPVAVSLLSGGIWLSLKPTSKEAYLFTAQKPALRVPALSQSQPAPAPLHTILQIQPAQKGPDQPATSARSHFPFTKTVHRQVPKDQAKPNLSAQQPVAPGERAVPFHSTVSTDLLQKDTASAISLAPVSTGAKAVVTITPEEDSISVIDTASVVIVQKQPDTIAKPAADTVALIKKSIAKKQTIRNMQPGWMLEAGAGLSSLHRSIAGSSASFVYDNYYVANPSGTLSGSPVTVQPFVLPQSNLGMQLGISRRQNFGPHWQGQLALQYQFVSATQRYGTTAGTGNSNQFSRRDSAAVFTTGTINTYRNRQHQLRLVPRIAYCINPKAALPIDFQAGVSIGYNLHSNLLLHDYNSRSYVRSPAYTAPWLIAAEMGFGIFIHNSIYTGLSYQHGLSNVARPVLQSNFRWRVWQVRVGIPLFHHSSK